MTVEQEVNQNACVIDDFGTLLAISVDLANFVVFKATVVLTNLAVSAILAF